MTKPTDLLSLQGNVALITGAASGLGAAMAEHFAAQGARLILVDRNASGLDKLATQLSATGASVLTLVGDMADAKSVAHLAQAALRHWGRIDTVICNAGIEGPVGAMHEAPKAARDHLFQVNLFSNLDLLQKLLPEMSRQGAGSIILMSSIAGLRGNRHIGLYGVTKAALAQVARNLAVEWGPKGIRVNAIAPGLIRTPFAEYLMQDRTFIERRLAHTPLMRVGKPEEIAAVARLLASPGGAFMTGQTLVVDGGTLISDGN